MKVIFSNEDSNSQQDSPYMPHKGGLSVIIANYMNDDFPFHTHDFNELVIVLGGTGKHLINNEVCNLIAGDVFVLKDLDIHAIKDTKHLKFVNIAFSKDKLNMLGKDIEELPGFQALFVLEPLIRIHHGVEGSLRLGTADLLHVGEIACAMEKEYISNLPASESIISAYFMLLVVYLSRCYEKYVSSVPEKLFALINTISFIEINYAEELSLERLAQIADLSVNHFLRVFKESFNTTPINYIKHLRIRKACELMRHHYSSITEIAYAVGFSDSNYFSRVFKSIIGKSPSEYMKTGYT